MKKSFNKIYIEITNICNLNCSFCSKDSRPKKEMSINEFKIILDKIKDYTDSIYLHVKGEPLLHSKLDEILSICDKYKIKVCITTNGTLLKNKINILLNHNIKQINVSLHSENNYPNYFEDVFNSCDKLSKKTTIIYRIWVLKNLNVLSTNIVNKIKNHYFLDEKTLCKIQCEKNIELKEHLYLDKDYEFTWPQIDNNKGNTGTCLGGRTHIAILSNGIVVPCCLDSNGIINMGNIFKEDLPTILNKSLYKNLKESFQNNKIICNLCKSCTYRQRFSKNH